MNRDDLVLDNINLIYFVITQLGLMDQKELYYDSGIIALVRAAKEFDESKGYAFSTFAITAIRNEIYKDIRVNNTDKRRANFNAVSLNTPINIEDDSELMDLIPSRVNVEEEVMRKIDMENVRKYISRLTAKEQQILYMYIEKELTQKEIAQVLGTTQSYISRRLQIIIEKLRKYLKIERS